MDTIGGVMFSLSGCVKIVGIYLVFLKLSWVCVQGIKWLEEIVGFSGGVGGVMCDFCFRSFIFGYKGYLIKCYD